MQENDNVKALYRISLALNSQKKELEAWGYIKKAYRLSPADKQITDLYNILKLVKDEHDRKRNEQVKQEAKASNQNSSKNNDSQIIDDDSSEEDERSKSLKSGFNFSTNQKQKKKSDDEEIKIEEEKIPQGNKIL